MNVPRSLSFSNLKTYLRSPWVLVSSLLLGTLIGTQLPDLGQSIAPLGNLYLALLKMCVLPILTSGIILSVARLMAQPDASHYLVSIGRIFPFALGICSFTGLLAALVLGPGRQLNDQTLRSLGILINTTGVDLEIPLHGPIEVSDQTSPLATFLFNVVPENIFNALTQGQTLQVLFFTLVFGVSLGVLHRQNNSADPIFEVLENIYKSFNKLIAWLILLLPLGLLSLISAQIAKSGVEAIVVMAKFMLCSIVLFVVLYAIGILVIAKVLNMSWLKVLSAVREPTIVALATSSALAAMPVAITSLTDSLNCKQDISDMIMPLAITIGRFGQVAYFVTASLFVVQLYDKPLNIQNVVVILVGSILAGIASSGSTGIVTLSTLNVILNPLGLPLESVLLLFIAIDPLVDPLRTLCTLHTGIVATTMISGPKSIPSSPPTARMQPSLGT